MLKKYKNWRRKKELEAVLKWCDEFQKNNSNQRCFKTFKIWVTTRKLRI